MPRLGRSLALPIPDRQTPIARFSRIVPCCNPTTMCWITSTLICTTRSFRNKNYLSPGTARSARFAAWRWTKREKRLDALHALPAIEASEKLIQATQQRIQRQPKPRITPLRMALVAAAAALLLGIVNWFYVNIAPAPFDLRVLGQSDLLAGSEASLRVLFLDPRSGAPRTGVPIAIDLLGPAAADAANSPTNAIAHLASFTTDRFGSGTVRMQLPDWSPGKYQLRVSAQAGGGEDSITEAVTLRRSWQLMLTSDKPVYQPGQVIHLRSLGLAEPQQKTGRGAEAIFSLTDPKGNVVFRRHDVTSRFGIAWARLPAGGRDFGRPVPGRIALGDTKSAVTLQVKKYVLPKLKVAVELDRLYYQPGPESSRHGLGPLLLRQADRERRRGDHRDWASAWRSRAGRRRRKSVRQNHGPDGFLR